VAAGSLTLEARDARGMLELERGYWVIENGFIIMTVTRSASRR
jgi:hypothetical protein